MFVSTIPPSPIAGRKEIITVQTNPFLLVKHATVGRWKWLLDMCTNWPLVFSLWFFCVSIQIYVKPLGGWWRFPLLYGVNKLYRTDKPPRQTSTFEVIVDVGLQFTSKCFTGLLSGPQSGCALTQLTSNLELPLSYKIKLCKLFTDMTGRQN